MRMYERFKPKQRKKVRDLSRNATKKAKKKIEWVKKALKKKISRTEKQKKGESFEKKKVSNHTLETKKCRKSKKKTPNGSTTANGNNSKPDNVNNNNSMTVNKNSKTAKGNNSKPDNVNNNNSMTANNSTRRANNSTRRELVEKDVRPCSERFSIKPPRDYVRIITGENVGKEGMIISSATSWERVKNSNPPIMNRRCKYYIQYPGEEDQTLDYIMFHRKRKPEFGEYLKKIGSEHLEPEETSKTNNNGSNGSNGSNSSKAKNNNGSNSSKAKNNNGSNGSKAKNTSHEIKNDKGETISEMIKRIKSIQKELFIERKQKSEKNSDIQKKSSPHPCNIKDLEKEREELCKEYEKKELIEGEEDEKKLYKYIFLLVHTDKNNCNEDEKKEKMRKLINDITRLKSGKIKKREREERLREERRRKREREEREER